jgi:hypothetical protein
MRKDICVQHWVNDREARGAFEHVRGLVVRIANFV